MDKIYTINETKDLLKISRAKLYRLIQEGKIRPVKLDGRTLFKESELNRFIESLNGSKKK
jgi:excisionase family DNA binding protein